MSKKPTEQEPKEIKRDLYKVTVEVDVFVLAQNSSEAIRVGKDSAYNEMGDYATGFPLKITNISQLSKTWSDSIPYVPSGAAVKDETCKQIILRQQAEKEIVVSGASGMEQQEMDKIIEIQKGSKRPDQESVPESRPDPKPSKDLNWEETKAQPKLRFKIGGE